MDSLVFVTEKRYGCAACNKSEEVLVLWDYYDTPLAPYCASCFVAKVVLILKNYQKVAEKIEVFKYR